MRRTPTGHRPNLKQKNSAGWSWPRLLPIHEQQQARESQESHSFAPNPFKAHEVLHEKQAQKNSPTGMDEEGPAEAALPLSHKSSAAEKAPETEESAATKSLQNGPSNEAVDRIAPISENDAQRSDVEDCGMLQSVAHDPVTSTEDPAEQPHETSTRRRRTNSMDAQTQVVDFENHRMQSDEPAHEGTNVAKQPEADSNVGLGSALSGIEEQPSNIQDQFTPRSTIDATIDDEPDTTDQPGVGTSTSRETNSNKATASEDQEFAEQMLDDETSIAAKGSVTDIPLEEKPRTPVTAPDQPVMDRISISADPIPYYANPKVMVHRPSESSQSNTSGPRTIDEVLAKEHRTEPAEQQFPAIAKDPNVPVSSVMPRLTDTPTGPGVHKLVKVKRRSLYLRKARNAAARNTILKMTLGRQLATPTKQALRQLAHGETVIEEPHIIQ